MYKAYTKTHTRHIERARKAGIESSKHEKLAVLIAELDHTSRGAKIIFRNHVNQKWKGKTFQSNRDIEAGQLFDQYSRHRKKLGLKPKDIKDWT